MNPEPHSNDNKAPVPNSPELNAVNVEQEPLIEIGGRPGPEPTRFGDWEKNGRCIDF